MICFGCSTVLYPCNDRGGLHIATCLRCGLVHFTTRKKKGRPARLSHFDDIAGQAAMAGWEPARRGKREGPANGS